jgi:hypothetical protein
MAFGDFDISKTWTAVTTGTGTVVFDSAKKATCVDPDGSSVAYIRRDLIVRPGEVVRVSAFVKTNSGPPRLVMNWPSFGEQVQNISLAQSSPDLIEYVAEFEVPLTAAATSIVYITIGGITAEISSCEVYFPKVEIISDIDREFGRVVDAGGSPSSGSGSYIQYSDGRMVCENQISITNCNTAWGQVFTSGLFSVPAFARTFVGGVSRSYNIVSATDGASAWIYSSNSQVGVARGTTSTATWVIRIRGTGFWRAV